MEKLPGSPESGDASSESEGEKISKEQISATSSPRRASKGVAMGLAGAMFAAAAPEKPADAGPLDTFLGHVSGAMDELHQGAQGLWQQLQTERNAGKGNPNVWNPPISPAPENTEPETAMDIAELNDRAARWAHLAIEIASKTITPLVINASEASAANRLRLEEAAFEMARTNIQLFALHIQEGTPPGTPGVIDGTPTRESLQAAASALIHSLKRFNTPFVEPLQKAAAQIQWETGPDADALRRSLRK